MKLEEFIDDYKNKLSDFYWHKVNQGADAKEQSDVNWNFDFEKFLSEEEENDTPQLFDFSTGRVIF